MPHNSLAAAQLSPAARTVWAKTRTDPLQMPPLVGWLPLYQHLDDAAGVARLLWDEWAPASVKSTIGASISDETAARDLLVWLAGIHDIGKASPAFAVQVDRLADDMRSLGLVCDPTIKDSDERRGARHELVGFIATSDWLTTSHGFAKEHAEAISSVVAAHHGRPASSSEIQSARPRPHLVGDGAWADVRNELLDAAGESFVQDSSWEFWREAGLTQPVLVLLSSLVIVADWIASSDLFESAQLGQPPARPTSERVAEAWRQLDFPGPWQHGPEPVDAAHLLSKRFGLPEGTAPYPAQAALVELAHTIERPELMILESEMGSGKTEAALLAAEVLAARFGMSGIFVGLPTQATSDGMFSRVLKWADRLGLDAPASVFLARSRSGLNPEFEKKTREAYFRSIGDHYSSRREAASGSLVIAHRWFADPRRGPLSNFVVGTVDQALFAGLRSRYVMLRHLALASKVVVIDEVHAYDIYMRQYLVRVIEWLGAYGVPVILLSATLPSVQREELVRAYDRGRESTSPVEQEDDDDVYVPPGAQRAATTDTEDARYASLRGELTYPSISCSTAMAQPRVISPGETGSERGIQLERIPDDLDTLIAILRSALRDGGCAAVICNTVRRAQERVEAIRAAFSDEPETIVTLAHSRFLGVDRAAKDRWMLDRFGPNGDRPYKSIVIATQVIEQSLDIDFDVMITDAAPVDLLLQRSGRLHRHAGRLRPGPLRRARLLLTGVEWEVTPPAFDSGTTAVYSEAVLLRTLATLNRTEQIVLPRDIPGLVEIAYGDDLEIVPAAWREALDRATREHRKKQLQSEFRAQAGLLQAVRADHPTLVGWVAAAQADPELSPPGQRTVRDSEETLEVIVLQRDSGGTFFLPAWVPGKVRQVPSNERPSPEMTRDILGCVLRLPAGMCRGNAIDRHIATLERAFDLPLWHGSYALKGELVLALGMDGRAQLNEFDLSYSPEDGLRYARRTA